MFETTTQIFAYVTDDYLLGSTLRKRAYMVFYKSLKTMQPIRIHFKVIYSSWEAMQDET